MPFLRGIFLIAAIGLALLLIRQLYRSHQQQRQRQQTTDRPPRSMAYAQTVACDHCRTHAPKTETIHQDGRYFCSADCRQQYQSH
ncbi:MAG: PP0621 family protein [Gammaproteobacteria bacterium]|nr:PP0621 family protein [Gammaproteobacteria bacterium]